MNLQERSTDAERSLIGAMILDPATIDVATGIVSDADFAEPDARTAFRVTAALRDAGEAVTIDRIVRSGVPAAFAGKCCHHAVASSAEAYARDVRCLSMMRAIMAAARSFSSRVEAEAAEAMPDPSRLADWMFARLEQAVAGGSSLTTGLVCDFADEALRDIAEAIQRQGQMGQSTGFVSVDETIGGLFPGELTTIAARPGIGKTSLAIQICRHVASLGKRAVMFSLEMTGKELAQRSLCSAAEVSNQMVRSGAVDGNTFAKLQDAADGIREFDFHIDDSPETDIGRIRAICKMLATERHIDIVAVDYIGLVNPSASFRSRKRTEQVGEVTKGLKALAKTLDCPVVALSQVNREAAKEGWLRLHHLSESSSIENDSNAVWFIQRKPAESPTLRDKVFIDVAKNRNGQTGQIQIGWDPDITRFRDLEASDLENHEPAFDEWSG
ncbi:Replicative DNA helicase [Crateriforma conspicua]|uniref:DNA 5'-3' helicase n=1 Tax=Crateriforma conspicua TaxID=2527996 RepID=A0A5C6FVA8_9PLAN|nr:DnaB-like helicase C-terminal domain-containing protein [Crateriforma conspicua]TWU66909.1 Replicative DNA helicase [Crateriforma conspicua]